MVIAMQRAISNSWQVCDKSFGVKWPGEGSEWPQRSMSQLKRRQVGKPLQRGFVELKMLLLKIGAKN